MPKTTAGFVIDLNGTSETPPEERDGTTALGIRRALAVLFKQSAPGVATPGRLGADHFVVTGSPTAMTYTVTGGGILIVRSSSGGVYLVGMPESMTFATPASDGVNPRYDRIYVRQPDPAFDGAAVDVDFTVDVVSGSPAASPIAPSLPPGAFEIARKLIGAGVSNTAGGAAFTNVAPVTGLAIPSLTKAEARAQAGIFTGTGAPSPSLGENGDLYFQRI